MIRTEHRVATWIALVAIVACSGPDAASNQPPAEAPVVAAAPAPAAVPSDAAYVNRVLDPAGWSDPRVRAAYAAAKKHARVLESIYCYCHCKENMGHRGLVECFESDHASGCDVCMTEAMMAAKMTEQGRTPREIQKAIDAFYAG